MIDYGQRETDAVIGRMDRMVADIYRQTEEELQKKLDDYLARFKVKDAIKREMLRKGEITLEEYNYWRTGQIMIGKRWEEMRNTIAQDLHNVNNIARSTIYGYMPEVYALNHNYATFQVEKGSMLDTSYTLYDRQTVERIMRSNSDLLPPPGPRKKAEIAAGKDIKWQSRQLQSAMTKSILAGDSIPHIAKRLSNELSVTNRKAAERYARTAATGAQNAGRVDAYKRAQGMGIEMEQEWLATLDGRTRHEHRYLDGQHVPVGKPFTVDGYELRFPGDPAGPGYLIWNCRCTLVPRLKNLDQSDAPRKSKLGGMSYDEWKNEHRKTETVDDTSIGGLRRPIRPRQSEYGGYTDEFLQARDRYKAELEQYNAQLDKAVNASLDSTAFSSRAELESWAAKNGIYIEPGVLDSIDIRSFNEVKPTLEEMFRRFPEVKGYTAEGYTGEKLSFHFRIGTTDDGLLSANGGFNFNPRYFGDYENGLRTALDSIADGTFVRGDGSFSTLVRHEYGHNVQNYVERRITDKYHMGVDDWRIHYSRFEDYQTAQTQYHSEYDRYKQELLSLANLDGASEYSNTNTLELFAEGFAEWSSGSNTEFGRAFGAFLRRWY